MIRNIKILIVVMMFSLTTKVIAMPVISTYAFKQKIHIIHLAPGYVATVVLPFAVTPNHVFIGNPNEFQAQIVNNGKTIIVKPITYAYHVSTNMVILGKYQFVYKLISGKPENANSLIYVKNPWTDSEVASLMNNKLKTYELQLNRKYEIKKIALLKEIKLLQTDKKFIISEFLKLNKVDINSSESHRGVTLKLKYVSRAGKYDYVKYKLINDSGVMYTVVNVTVSKNNVPLSIYKDDLLKPVKPNSIVEGFIIFKTNKKDLNNFNLLMTAASKNSKLMQFNESF